MREFDVATIMTKKFSTYVDGMDEVVFRQEPAAKQGDQKLFLQVFSSPDESAPLKKISFMILEEGRIKNKDDKGVLDLGEFTVATFIPGDTCPLPLFAMEMSWHFDKYIQCRAEISPLSRDARYTDAFCKPVQALRNSLDALPGLSPQTTLPGLEDFSSGGLMAGHIEPQHKEIVLRWFLHYADLYLSFFDRRDKYPVLKEPAIIAEACERKAVFCGMFAKMTPAILSDLPDLHSSELGQKLAGILF